jgi:hypothetical protein
VLERVRLRQEKPVGAPLRENPATGEMGAGKGWASQDRGHSGFSVLRMRALLGIVLGGFRSAASVIRPNATPQNLEFRDVGGVAFRPHSTEVPLG